MAGPFPDHVRRRTGLISVGVASAALGGLLAGPGLAAAGDVANPFSRSHVAGAAAPVAKNVIFIVGDGMSAAARQAGRLNVAGLDRDLFMNDMPFAGLQHTSSADAVVTDSAAAGTSFATGVKTFNGAIGVDAQGNRVTTLLEQAKAAGKATGLVTTAQVTDATPAAFGAHVRDRAQQSEIARQFLEQSKPDVILGGGEDRWFPPGNPGFFPDAPAQDPTEGSSSDRGNLVQRARQLGYDVVHTPTALRQADGPKLLGLFANEEMFQQRPEGAGDVYDPVVSLPTMATKALQVLSRHDEGFFLLLEEEAIDEFAHNDNGRRVLQAMNQLDRTVAIAKDFALRHPDTLVVVTGDHETGGLTVEGPDDPAVPDESGDGISEEDGPFDVAGSDLQFVIDWTTAGHSAVDIPVTAMGPGAQRFTGIYENTFVHDAMLTAMLGRR
jgi:alkaline phosphatase